MDTMTLGQKIAQFRKAKGWTQTQLAEKVGVHPSHVTRWERDRNQPSAATLQQLAEAFEAKVEDLTKAPAKRSLQETFGEDDQLLTQFLEIQTLPEKDRATIVQVIDAFLVKKRMQEALGI